MRYWESIRKRSTRPTLLKRPSKRAGKKSGPSSSKSSITSGGSLRQYPFLRTFYQHQAVISDGIQKFIFFLVVATLLYVFVFGDAGAIRVITLKNQKTQLETRVTMLKTDVVALQDQIDRLKSDPYMMEKLGRERYGFLYPGERVYKIIRSPERQ